jgi:hypothetical protein
LVMTGRSFVVTCTDAPHPEEHEFPWLVGGGDGKLTEGV